MRFCQINNPIGRNTGMFRDGLLPGAMQVLFDGYQKVLVDTTLIRVNTRFLLSLHLSGHHNLQALYQLMSLQGADMMIADFQR